jgi:hypothetical protein
MLRHLLLLPEQRRAFVVRVGVGVGRSGQEPRTALVRREHLLPALRANPFVLHKPAVSVTITFLTRFRKIQMAILLKTFDMIFSPYVGAIELYFESNAILLVVA